MAHRGDATPTLDDVFAAVGLERSGRGSRKKAAAARPASLPGVQVLPIEVLRVADWAKLDWLQHGFSTRTGGTSTVYRPGENRAELNLGFTAADDVEKVSENRRIYLAAVAGATDPTGQEKQLPALVVLKQIHSSLIRKVSLTDISVQAPGAGFAGDGLMTDQPGVLLGILTADCIPILVADRKKRAVAAFHAGWRGTLKRIVEGGVGRMRLEFGSRPEDLMAAIGPGIGCCCYSVGEEVRHEFESQFSYAPELFREVSDSDPVKQKYPMLFMTARAPGHSDLGPSLHLDLAEANRRQLLDAGLKAKHISMLNDCTSCHPERYFSHRQQQGFTGRMMAVIGIRNGRA